MLVHEVRVFVFLMYVVIALSFLYLLLGGARLVLEKVAPSVDQPHPEKVPLWAYVTLTIWSCLLLSSAALYWMNHP